MELLKNRKLHREDKKLIYEFIDYARLAKGKPLNVKLEIAIRYIAIHIGISAETTNGRLANKFADLLEKKLIK